MKLTFYALEIDFFVHDTTINLPLGNKSKRTNQKWACTAVLQVGQGFAAILGAFLRLLVLYLALK